MPVQFAPPVKNTSLFLVKLNKQINNPILGNKIIKNVTGTLF